MSRVKGLAAKFSGADGDQKKSNLMSDSQRNESGKPSIAQLAAKFGGTVSSGTKSPSHMQSTVVKAMAAKRESESNAPNRKCSPKPFESSTTKPVTPTSQDPQKQSWKTGSPQHGNSMTRNNQQPGFASNTPAAFMMKHKELKHVEQKAQKDAKANVTKYNMTLRALPMQLQKKVAEQQASDLQMKKSTWEANAKRSHPVSLRGSISQADKQISGENNSRPGLQHGASSGQLTKNELKVAAVSKPVAKTPKLNPNSLVAKRAALFSKSTLGHGVESSPPPITVNRMLHPPGRSPRACGPCDPPAAKATRTCSRDSGDLVHAQLEAKAEVDSDVESVGGIVEASGTPIDFKLARKEYPKPVLSNSEKERSPTSRAVAPAPPTESQVERVRSQKEESKEESVSRGVAPIPPTGSQVERVQPQKEESVSRGVAPVPPTGSRVVYEQAQEEESKDEGANRKTLAQEKVPPGQNALSVPETPTQQPTHDNSMDTEKRNDENLQIETVTVAESNTDYGSGVNSLNHVKGDSEEECSSVAPTADAERDEVLTNVTATELELGLDTDCSESDTDRPGTSDVISEKLIKDSEAGYHEQFGEEFNQGSKVSVSSSSSDESSSTSDDESGSTTSEELGRDAEVAVTDSISDKIEYNEGSLTEHGDESKPFSGGNQHRKISSSSAQSQHRKISSSSAQSQHRKISSSSAQSQHRKISSSSAQSQHRKISSSSAQSQHRKISKSGGPSQHRRSNASRADFVSSRTSRKVSGASDSTQRRATRNATVEDLDAIIKEFNLNELTVEKLDEMDEIDRISEARFSQIATPRSQGAPSSRKTSLKSVAESEEGMEDENSSAIDVASCLEGIDEIEYTARVSISDTIGRSSAGGKEPMIAIDSGMSGSYDANSIDNRSNDLDSRGARRHDDFTSQSSRSSRNKRQHHYDAEGHVLHFVSTVSLRRVLKTLYMDLAREKLRDIDVVLEHFAGREPALIKVLECKYQIRFDKYGNYKHLEELENDCDDLVSENGGEIMMMEHPLVRQLPKSKATSRPLSLGRNKLAITSSQESIDSDDESDLFSQVFASATSPRIVHRKEQQPELHGTRAHPALSGSSAGESQGSKRSKGSRIAIGKAIGKFAVVLKGTRNKSGEKQASKSTPLSEGDRDPTQGFSSCSKPITQRGIAPPPPLPQQRGPAPPPPTVNPAEKTKIVDKLLEANGTSNWM